MPTDIPRKPNEEKVIGVLKDLMRRESKEVAISEVWKALGAGNGCNPSEEERELVLEWSKAPEIIACLVYGLCGQNRELRQEFIPQLHKARYVEYILSCLQRDQKLRRYENFVLCLTIFIYPNSVYIKDEILPVLKSEIESNGIMEDCSYLYLKVLLALCEVNPSLFTSEYATWYSRKMHEVFKNSSASLTTFGCTHTFIELMRILLKTSGRIPHSESDPAATGVFFTAWSTILELEIPSFNHEISLALIEYAKKHPCSASMKASQLNPFFKAWAISLGVDDKEAAGGEEAAGEEKAARDEGSESKFFPVSALQAMTAVFKYIPNARNMIAYNFLPCLLDLLRAWNSNDESINIQIVCFFTEVTNHKKYKPFWTQFGLCQIIQGIPGHIDTEDLRFNIQ